MRFCRTRCLTAMAFMFVCVVPLAAQAVGQSGLQQTVPVRAEGGHAVSVDVGERSAIAGYRTKGIDLLNLEQNVPVRIEDAYVLPSGVAAAYVSTNPAWSHTETWWQTEAAVAWGLSGRSQATLGVNLKHSELDQLGNGDVWAKFSHQFHVRPGQDAALWGVELNFPTGQDYARLDGSVPPYQFVIDPRQQRVDFALLGVWTKLLKPDSSQRLHLQARRDFVNSAGTLMRSDRWLFAAAYDRLLTDNTLAVANLWWQESPRALDTGSSAVQFGLRHRESDRFLWGSSVAVGLGWQEASWGLGLSGEYQFTP